MPTCKISPARQVVAWDGKTTNVSFIVDTPESIAKTTLVGSCIFSVNGLRIGHVPFEMTLSDRAEALETAVAPSHAIEQAFASYAHQDRLQVLPRVAGIEKVGVKVYFDTHDLKSNDDWRKRIHAMIDHSDVLYLFWSQHAKESKEVDHEWRYGLETRGVKFIDPVPLVDPRKVPPPPELADKHFHDWTLVHLGYEKSLGKEGQ